ncbi:MAG: hypothetical protein H6567_03330 [Lewinellaceae bacterium]|nr:hypothetical protein [Lewinellaceae bacterium]
MYKALIFGLLSFLIVGCKFDKGDPNGENILSIRLKNDPERINPILFPNPLSREVYQYLFLPLADYDPNTLLFSPVMIVDIPKKVVVDTGMYKGHTRLDVEILEKAVWDDGSPITGYDYAFTIKAINLRYTNAKNYRQLTQSILDVQVDANNPKKFSIIVDKNETLSQEVALNVEVYPAAFYDRQHLLANYTVADFSVNNPDSLQDVKNLKAFADSFNSAIYSRDSISGSGPYHFDQWIANQSITIKKKSDYWGSNFQHASLMQGPDIIRFFIIPDELLAITQLKSGNIDVINEMSATQFLALKNDSAFTSQFHFLTPSLTKQYVININNHDLILKDINVRKALSYLLDVDNIIDVIEQGMGRRSTGYIHPEKETYDKSIQPAEYNPQKAAELLTLSGWKDNNGDGVLDKKIDGKVYPLKLEILISGQELGKKIALMLQEKAEKIGMKIDIKEKDFKLIRAENLKTRKYQLVPAVVSQDIIRWDDLSKFYGPNDTPNGVNDISFHNAEVDSIITKLEHPMDDGDRISLYKNFQKIIDKETPLIFLYSPMERIVVSKKWDAEATMKRPGYLANTFTKSVIAQKH